MNGSSESIVHNLQYYLRGNMRSVTELVNTTEGIPLRIFDDQLGDVDGRPAILNRNFYWRHLTQS